MLTEEAEAAGARQPPPWPLAAGARSERGRLDQLLGRDVVHQGVALLADLLAPPPSGAGAGTARPDRGAGSGHRPAQVGAILRSAAAFGAAA